MRFELKKYIQIKEIWIERDRQLYSQFYCKTKKEAYLKFRFQYSYVSEMKTKSQKNKSFYIVKTLYLYSHFRRG